MKVSKQVTEYVTKIMGVKKKIGDIKLGYEISGWCVTSEAYPMFRPRASDIMFGGANIA